MFQLPFNQFEVFMLGNWRIVVAIRLFGTASGGRLMSFVGLLSISGLTVAVAVLLTVLSVVNGFERELRERVLAVLPHGTVYSRTEFTDWHAERVRLLSHPEVQGVAPVVEGAGLIVTNGKMQGVNFRGIDPALEASVSIMPQFVFEDALTGLTDKRYGTIVGADLARVLDIVPGDKITLVLPDVSFSLAGPVITTRRLSVLGIFEVGADIDKNYIYINIEDARRLKRQRNIDGLVVRMEDLFQAPRVLHELVTQSDSRDLYAVSWMRQNGNLYDAIGTQKATLFLLLMILVAVAIFNVVSNLVMTVDDNRSEIAILKTMGASPLDINLIFIMHGLMVGLVGLVSGLILGVLLTLSISSFYSVISELFELNLMSEYFIRYLPTDIQWFDLVIITVVCMAISLLATIYPAARAAAANPIEALQYEL